MSLLQNVAGTNASNAHSPAPSLPSNQGCASGVGCNGTSVCGQKGGANNKKNNKTNNKKNNAKKNNANNKNNKTNKKNNAKKNNANNKKNNKTNKKNNKTNKKNNKNNANNKKNNKTNKKNNKNKSNNKKNNTKKNNNKKNNKNNTKKNNGILIKCQRVQSGGGYGFTQADADMAAKSGMGYGSMPFSSYSNCGTTRASGIGAGIQHGGGLPLVPANVDSNSMLVANPPAVNNNLRPGYGYVSGKDNLLFAGSGYPLETPYNGNSCAQGGGKRKTRKRRRKGGYNKGSKSKTHSGNNFTTRKNSKNYNEKRLKNLTGNSTMRAPVFSYAGGRRIQKGGYSQYQSNVPNTPGYAQPNPGPLPWATGPGSYTRQINCVDNYNHFTGKGGPSPVLDKGVSQ